RAAALRHQPLEREQPAQRGGRQQPGDQQEGREQELAERSAGELGHAFRGGSEESHIHVLLAAANNGAISEDGGGFVAVADRASSRCEVSGFEPLDYGGLRSMTACTLLRESRDG